MNTSTQPTVNPNKTIISVGNSYHIYDDSVKTHSAWPVATYKISFNPMAGHSVIKVEDLTEPAEKMYGNGQKRIGAILKGFEAMNRSYGVLASGNGGMGKTMLMRSLAVQASQKFSLPIFLIDAPSPGLAQYIGNLGPAIVLFDEFEKIFDSDSEDGDQQVQFLSLFDGLGQSKQLYLATVNNLKAVNSYMLNRTGRFHKHLRFTYPASAEVQEYLTDQGVAAEVAKEVAVFSTRVPLNYDHLRAVAFELLVTGDSFSEVIRDLNIKRMNGGQNYTANLVFDGATGKSVVHADLFNLDTDLSFWTRVDGDEINVSFSVKDVVFDEESGTLSLPPKKVTVTTYDEELYHKNLLSLFLTPFGGELLDY